METRIKKVTYSFIFLAIIGFIDSLYLLTIHYLESPIYCSEFSDCNVVLNSEYATLFGIPIALFGAIYYAFVLILSSLYLEKKKIKVLKVIAGVSIFGMIASVRFVYLQAFVIYAFCDYCLLSAATSILIFIVAVYAYLKIFRQKNLSETVANSPKSW